MNQLLEIRKNFLLIAFFLLTFGASSQSYQSDLDSIFSIMKTRDFQAAKSFALEAKSRNDKRAGSAWLIKSNLHLGYIYSREDDFVKAIITYLEGLRYSKEADYEGVQTDVSTLYYRCGLIFADFRAYSLAEEYYVKGLENAKLHNLSEIELNHKYVLAALFVDMERYEEAINLLSECVSNLKPTARLYFTLHHRLGLTYHQLEEFDKTISIYEKLINELPDDNWRAKGSYHHNLARSYRESKDYEKALANYKKAIEFKQLLGDEEKLFSSYYGTAETYFALKEYKKSENYFLKAENLIDSQPLHPEYFEIYKACAGLNYTLKNYEKSKHYEDLHTAKMNEYLKIQAEIQETDQRYNMELITKRYFAEVEKQERIASILMYSKLTSGGLLALLLIVIAHHRYQKVRLRKSIERELIALKIVD